MIDTTDPCTESPKPVVIPVNTDRPGEAVKLSGCDIQGCVGTAQSRVDEACIEKARQKSEIESQQSDQRCSMNVGSNWFELNCRISNGSKSLLEELG